MTLRMSVPFADEVDRSAAFLPLLDGSLLMGLVLPNETEAGSEIFGHWRGASQDLDVRAAVPAEEYAARLASCLRKLGATHYISRDRVGDCHQAAIREKDHGFRLPQA